MTAERSYDDFTDAFVGYGDEEPMEILYDARTNKRAEAIRCHALEYDADAKEVVCVTRYARWLPRQELWDLAGRERYDEEIEEEIACPACGAPLGETCCVLDNDLPCDERVAPDEPPEDWVPSDDDPSWEFCKLGDDGAIQVYVCDTGQ